MLRRSGNAFQLSGGFTRVNLPTLVSTPRFAKLLVKIGDDCFSTVLACVAHGGGLRCTPERSAFLRGHVTATGGGPLPGTMITAFDDGRLESVSVFAQTDGRFVFPRLRPGTYRLRARRIGWADVEEPIRIGGGHATTRNLVLAPTDDTNDQLPAASFFGLLLDKWPSPTVRGDFTLSCGNCHQIAGPRFLEDKTLEEWPQVVATITRRRDP